LRSLTELNAAQVERRRALLVTRNVGAPGEVLLQRVRALTDAEPIVIGPHIRPNIARHRFRVSLSETESLAQLHASRYTRVFLHGIDTDEPLPSPLLREIFSRPIRSIEHIDEFGALSAHRPFAALEGKAKVLELFPASPIPLDKGANQRVFSVVSHLNRKGIATDLLITTSRYGDLARLARLLRAIAPTVHVYRNDRRMLAPRKYLRRFAERVRRFARGIVRRPTDLFNERLETRNSRDGRDRLRELTTKGQYHHLIVNFAWMTEMLDAIPSRARKQLRCHCDTHDVQFIRDAPQQYDLDRIGVDGKEQRNAEIRALARYDTVVAISGADADALSEHLPQARVVRASAGFDYAYRRVPETALSGPFHFGFLGRNMPANSAALHEVLTQWWPRIRSISPASYLYVAGTICESRDVRSLLAKTVNVEALGFVPTLTSFYERIQIALNPVFVQGGLNFKSVEATAAGCVLATTPLGTRCLGDNSPAMCISSPDEVRSILGPLLNDPEELHRRRLESQRWCRKNFYEQQSYEGLRELLSDAS